MSEQQEPMVMEVDCSTGEQTIRLMTNEEKQNSILISEQAEAQRIIQEQEEAARLAAKESAIAKLSALGLTEEEVQAIVG